MWVLAPAREPRRLRAAAAPRRRCGCTPRRSRSTPRTRRPAPPTRGAWDAALAAYDAAAALDPSRLAPRAAPRRRRGAAARRGDRRGEGGAAARGRARPARRGTARRARACGGGGKGGGGGEGAVAAYRELTERLPYEAKHMAELAALLPWTLWEKPDSFDMDRGERPFTNEKEKGWKRYNPELRHRLYPSEVQLGPSSCCCADHVLPRHVSLHHVSFRSPLPHITSPPLATSARDRFELDLDMVPVNPQLLGVGGPCEDQSIARVGMKAAATLHGPTYEKDLRVEISVSSVVTLSCSSSFVSVLAPVPWCQV
ncbi:hypothetical protein AB1Y20_016530 [Prymnesium parvum]|uniref:Uncharacterized protein n=1 Tax=Prymnesium parvum TaxID=97485 RepID=A0AB34IDK3_PRYPA